MSVSSEIIKVLDALGNKFGIAVNWTAENIVPYLEELFSKFINYEVATSVIWLLLGFMMLVSIPFLWKPFKTYYKKANNYDDYDWYEIDKFTAICVILGVLMGCFLLFGIAIVLCQTFDIITCYTLPEKILLREITNIYETMK